jgi:hypothetical protein
MASPPKVGFKGAGLFLRPSECLYQYHLSVHDYQSINPLPIPVCSHGLIIQDIATRCCEPGGTQMAEDGALCQGRVNNSPDLAVLPVCVPTATPSHLIPERHGTSDDETPNPFWAAPHAPYFFYNTMVFLTSALCVIPKSPHFVICL